MSRKTTALNLRRLACVSLITLLGFTQAHAEEWQYTVKDGDNLWDIAEDFLIDMRYWRKLQQHNQITEPRSLRPGSVLSIPISWSVVKPATALVVQMNGTVNVTPGNSTNESGLELGQRLNVGDKIATGEGASITLKFPDASSLVLRENSELIIETLETYGKEDGFNTQLHLQRGRTETQANPEKRNSTRFEIHTPSATAAVRGTVYRVNAESADSTASEVVEGRVAVQNTMGATDVPGGYGTRVMKDAPPTPPVALLPPATLEDLPAVFERLPIRHRFQNAIGAEAFRVQVAEAATTDFSELLVDETAQAGLGIPDLPDGDYRLLVRGIDDHGLEGNDSVSQFRVNVRPEPPLVITPQIDAVMQPAFSQFVWTAREEAARYHLEVSDSRDFANKIVDAKSLTEASYTLESPLTPGTWFWRLTAISEHEGAGPKGDVISFRVMNAGPEMETPALDGDSGELTLQWSASLPDDQYQIQIADDAEFTQLQTDAVLDEPAYTQSQPAPGSTIYIRTKIIASDGLEGSWSAPQQVDVPTDPPYWLSVFLPLLLML